jgi:ribonucleoside-diphosphate reductase subunit M2
VSDAQLDRAEAAFGGAGFAAGEGEVCAVVWPNTAPGTVLEWLKIAAAAPDDAGDAFLEGDGRLIIDRVEHPEIDALKNEIKALHWFSEETRFDVDALDARELEKSSPELMALVRTVIGLSMVSDGLILDGLEGAVGEKLGNVIEAGRYLAFVAQNEAVHEESYLLQGKAIAGAGVGELIDAVRSMPSVGRLADWGRFWTACDHPAAALFAGLAFVEGAMFQGIFAVLQFLKTLGKFPGVVHVNEFVARDEWVHTQFWIMLSTKKLDRRMPRSAVEALARASAEVSAGFFREAMPAAVPGMSAELLAGYVEFINDFVAGELSPELAPGSGTPVFGTADPFPFMKLLRMGAKFRKTNFFERESSAYRKDQADADADFSLGEVGVGADEIGAWPL